MNFDRIKEKLSILADAAKYDVSCSSSGSKRRNTEKGLGNSTGMGICHSYTEDGRCVSLLKILLTNHCIYDCAYCVTRRSNDVKRAAFKVQEVVDLTIAFYRRNYIEGLFLSSGIFKSPDHTMERLIEVAKKLRLEERFNGYIHLKSIPGASDELMKEAGLYADRLSVNIEIPTRKGLENLAPEKKREDFFQPMATVRNTIDQFTDERRALVKVPRYAPAGQSTQMIVGASDETDFQVLQASSFFYEKFKLKRVYYSGYVPIREDKRLPGMGSPVPVLRENRLYQADWLMRFYEFKATELLSPQHPFFDEEVDPKLNWALHNRHLFPVDVNTASKHMLLRVPGIGPKSVAKILSARRYARLHYDQLKKMGIAMNRAQYFIKNIHAPKPIHDWSFTALKSKIVSQTNTKFQNNRNNQLSLF